MLYKICSACGAKVKVGTTCKCRLDRHKVYDREHRDKDSAKFYNSKAWKQVTNLCKIKANGLDEYELYVNKRVVKGSLSHHIEELKDNRDRGLDITNLIYLSDKSHAHIHEQYKRDKKKMQELLFSIVRARGW